MSNFQVAELWVVKRHVLELLRGDAEGAEGVERVSSSISWAMEELKEENSCNVVPLVDSYVGV